MFHLVPEPLPSSSALAASRAGQLFQLTSRVDLSRADDWRCELETLCSAFVCADGKEGRLHRVRIALMAAGAEGLERMTCEGISRKMHVPQAVVHRETHRIFVLIRDAAAVGALPRMHWLPAGVQMELGLDSVLCARVMSEVMLHPIGLRMDRYVRELYAGTWLVEQSQVDHRPFSLRHCANSAR